MKSAYLSSRDFTFKKLGLRIAKNKIMSSHGELLHQRHHFHGCRSFLRPEYLPVKPTGVPAFYFRRNCYHFSGLRLRNLGFGGISGLLLISKCGPDNLSPEWHPNHASEPLSFNGDPLSFGLVGIRMEIRLGSMQEEASLMTVLKGANSFLPQVVLASTVLALIYPPSFTWFTNRYYAPALGFLMFAVGVNSSEKDFLEAFRRPAAIFAGYIGQFVVKPLLGIVMTSLSTATAVFVTPFLSLLLIGKKLPVDVKGMVSNILQIVVTPIATGLLLNRFFPKICNAIRPLLPPLSVFVTALCVGAPLAINVESVMSPSGISVLLLVIAFHLSAFIAGFTLTGLIFHDLPDAKALQRTLSYETGMQSSLLALALANRFFQDPLVSIPPAISTVIMSLMGFSLVMLWARRKETAVQ
ncbi:putative sodium/metabolite cotransporter BASS6, chloroplastic [Sesamum angolense]|uniref:Sodium/metabolite cotransporter BASS6, chloroplastic n=1 Tax=Sesamum angolense TaxID=2727404 RepID=A0AAE2BL49_9LAMI|nr:putative sodium/metabolite cotransporter BASS6, chloroplastic [Sesamum angolense]